LVGDFVGLGVGYLVGDFVGLGVGERVGYFVYLVCNKSRGVGNELRSE
jgi:hypothetical protein